MPAISLIIPVYNTEKYLHRCLDSVLSQTFTDYEVILIDDGSTDNSPSVCDDYALKDSRFKVFHKQNEGLPATRKYGTNKASGKYILHLDSDDWIEHDMLEEMHSAAIHSDADYVICDFYMDYVSHKVVHRNRFSDINDTRKILCDCITGKVSGYIWNRLIKAECFKKNNIQFPPNLNYGEDMILNAQLLSLPAKIKYIPKPLYHYMQNPASMIHGKAAVVYEKLKLKTEWITKFLGNDFFKELTILRYKELTSAFRAGIVSGSEFKNIKLGLIDKLKQMKYNGLRLNICLLFSIIGLYSVSDMLRNVLFKRSATK